MQALRGVRRCCSTPAGASTLWALRWALTLSWCRPLRCPTRSARASGAISCTRRRSLSGAAWRKRVGRGSGRCGVWFAESRQRSGTPVSPSCLPWGLHKEHKKPRLLYWRFYALADCPPIKTLPQSLPQNATLLFSLRRRHGAVLLPKRRPSFLLFIAPLSCNFIAMCTVGGGGRCGVDLLIRRCHPCSLPTLSGFLRDKAVYSLGCCFSLLAKYLIGPAMPSSFGCARVLLDM